jgi:hypothetical protein
MDLSATLAATIESLVIGVSQSGCRSVCLPMYRVIRGLGRGWAQIQIDAHTAGKMRSGKTRAYACGGIGE